ncbi:MAG: O-antigen/teichoic acid export membrane protein [Glaciecola sp.]
MAQLIPKYLGIVRRKTNAQLLAWQGFNFIKYSSVIVTAVLMARLIPDLELIKSYENILLLASAFSFFFVSGLGQTVIPYYEAQDIEQKESMFKSLFYLLFILGLVSSLTLAFYGFYFSSKNTLNYLIFAIVMLLNIPSFALENYYLVQKKHLNLLSWGVLTYVIQIPVFLVPLFFFDSLQSGFIGLAVIASIKFIFTCFTLKIFTAIANLKKQTLHFLSYSWPVVLSFIIGGSYVYLNAFIVEHNLSSKDFVLYRYGAREFPLFLIIANSFSLVYSAKIVKGIKTSNSNNVLVAFKLKSKKVMHQLFPLAIILMLCSKYLFHLFYSEVYTEAYIVFNIMLFLLVSRMLFPQTLLFGYGKSKEFIYASLAELITGITLSVYLVDSHGLVGVSIAMIIASLTEKSFLIAICYRNKISFFKHTPIWLFLMYLGLMVVAFFTSIKLI